MTDPIDPLTPADPPRPEAPDHGNIIATKVAIDEAGRSAPGLSKAGTSRKKYFSRRIRTMLLGIGGLFAFLLLLIGFITLLIVPRLPDLHVLTDYRPKIPLRIFSADGVLIAEYGEERRKVVGIRDIPLPIRQAVLAIEDDTFYEHAGISPQGIARALFDNLSGGRGGASTITQQVARNFFLTSNEPTFGQKLFRKLFYEIPLALKIEHSLGKDQILEIYMNQIYLGQRAYGFAAAAETYFGKSLQDLTIAESAMLAGLPKAPSANNPIVNPKRAIVRQQYILLRMHQLGFISSAQYDEATREQLKLKTGNNEFGIHAEFVAEMARQLTYQSFPDDIYTRGINVITTITKADQDAAYLAARKGVLDYERRHGYRGPEGFMTIPEGAREVQDSAIEVELADYPESDGLVAAVVLEASPKMVQAVLTSGEVISISGKGLSIATNLLSAKAPPQRKLVRGAIIRVTQVGDHWEITQMPEVQTAFVALDPANGAIRALIGGFDFNRSKFNHVTQAWRQAGSAFKPFIYSAALEKGYSPGTIINDAPVSYGGGQTGGPAWTPKNYGGKYDGPMTIRRALALSRNTVVVQVMNHMGVDYTTSYLGRFGFDSDKLPPYLTLALGAGQVTPLQMAVAYATFANGGYKINPYLISAITDHEGHLLVKGAPLLAGDEANRVIEPRNAFMINDMLEEVIRSGTGRSAQVLGRDDIAGKSGTTNDSHDTWFAGYHPSLVAVSWAGYDQPHSLGTRETGGSLALPIWIDYMQKALKAVPRSVKSMPAGIVIENGDMHYQEFVPQMNSNVAPALNGGPATGSEQIRNQLF